MNSDDQTKDLNVAISLFKNWIHNLGYKLGKMYPQPDVLPNGGMQFKWRFYNKKRDKGIADLFCSGEGIGGYCHPFGSEPKRIRFTSDEYLDRLDSKTREALLRIQSSFCGISPEELIEISKKSRDSIEHDKSYYVAKNKRFIAGCVRYDIENEVQYFKNKGVSSYVKNCTRAFRIAPSTGDLVIPLWSIDPDTNGDFSYEAYQTIDTDGEKRFPYGGLPFNGFFSAVYRSKTNSPLILCEGIATALSLKQMTGFTTWSCCNCGNMKKVATNIIGSTLYKKIGEPIIIVAGDNDHMKIPNAGVSASMDIMKWARLNGNLDRFRFATPDFSALSPFTDWNDKYNETVPYKQREEAKNEFFDKIKVTY